MDIILNYQDGVLSMGQYMQWLSLLQRLLQLGEIMKLMADFQEYFEKLGMTQKNGVNHLVHCLGALLCSKKFGIPAIGGKDSMSGTFKDMDVPPTLVSFAVDIVDVNNVVSPEFKKVGSKVVLVSANIDKKAFA